MTSSPVSLPAFDEHTPFRHIVHFALLTLKTFYDDSLGSRPCQPFPLSFAAALPSRGRPYPGRVSLSLTTTTGSLCRMKTGLSSSASLLVLFALFVSWAVGGGITSTEVVVVQVTGDSPKSSEATSYGPLLGTGGPHTEPEPDSADFLVGGVGTKAGTTVVVTRTSLQHVDGGNSEDTDDHQTPVSTKVETTSTFKPGQLGDGEVFGQGTAAASSEGAVAALGSRESGDDIEDGHATSSAARRSSAPRWTGLLQASAANCVTLIVSLLSLSFSLSRA